MLQIFVYIFSIYLCIFVCANIFGAVVLKPRFKIDVVVVVVWSIVIVINSVLSLQVSTASLPHDQEPCKIKVVSNHTCSLHTCVCAGSRRVRVRLSGLINGRNQFKLLGVSSSAPFRSGSVPNMLDFFWLQVIVFLAFRFKIDTVVMIILCSLIIINIVLTL